MRPFLGFLTGVLLIFSTPAHANCGTVSIGEMNWDSSRVIANVTKRILEIGFGCTVELVSTTTVPAIKTQIETGKPDILSEIWVNSVREIYEDGVAKKQIVKASDALHDGGLEGWWIPSYMLSRYPGLDSIEGLKKNWKLFAGSDNPKKGRFFSCPSGWACRIINANLFKAYGMGDTFVSVAPATGEGLKQAIAQAYADKKPWVGYYWAPTAILGRYPMVQIKLNPADKAGHECNQKADCASPHAGSYPPSEVISTTTVKFQESHPDVFSVVAQVSIPNKDMNAVLAWGEKNRADGAAMAKYFMQTRRRLWQSWLPAKVVEKLDGAL